MRIKISEQTYRWLVGMLGERVSEGYIIKKYSEAGYNLILSRSGLGKGDQGGKIKRIWFALKDRSIVKDLIDCKVIFSSKDAPYLQKIFGENYVMDFDPIADAIDLVNGVTPKPHELKAIMRRFDWCGAKEAGINCARLKESMEGERKLLLGGVYRYYGRARKGDSPKKYIPRVLRPLAEKGLIEALKPLASAYTNFKFLIQPHRTRPDFIVFLQEGDVHVYEAKANQSSFRKPQRSFVKSNRDKIKIYLLNPEFKFPKSVKITETIL